MPTLKQLTCAIEWTGSNVPLQEFQPTYGDGYVHTFIAVPPIQTPFSIHLTSYGYIAPGLAMFVYMDGEYQCNRNRRNLRIPDENTRPKGTEIDFRVRQKEELQPDGTFCGQQWKFRELNIVSDPDAALESPAPHDAEHVGTIEVVVLRCYPASSEEKLSSKSASRGQLVGGLAPEESSDSSSEESPSDNGSESEFGGLFDGTGDERHNMPKSLPFGGDATSDQPSYWNNVEQQNSWNQGENSYAWGDANDSPNANALPTPGNKWGSSPAPSPRWERRASTSSNHFSEDWNKPSQAAQEAAQPGSSRHSNHGSRRSGRSSSSNHNARVVSTNNNWEANSPAQPSPAIVINVNQSPAGSRFGPPSVAEGWVQRPLPANLRQSLGFSQPIQGHVNSPHSSNNSGSNKSGSNHSGSNKSNGSQNQNSGGNDWQFSGGQTEGWGAAVQKLPGAWGESNNKPQETSDWNNNNGTNWDKNNNGGGTAWNEPNNQSPNGQNNGNGNTWNTTGENEGWHDSSGNASAGQIQRAQWTNEEVLKAYPDWASPNPQDQQQNTWIGGNAGDSGPGKGDGTGKRNGDGDKPEKLLWEGNDAVQDEPVGLFGSKPIPASESAKREGSIKLKHSNEAPAFTLGLQQAPTLGKPPVITLPYVAGAWPISSRAKPYWSKWNNGLNDQIPDIEEEPPAEPESEEGPLYSVPVEIAERSSMSHQVQIGRPAMYLHKVSKPKYMDSHDNPYAAFTFQYRSRAVIEKMFGVSLAETKEEEKERLSSLSKEELIDHYLKAKASASSQKSASGSNDSNTQKPMASGGLGLGGELANKLSQLNTTRAPSEKASTDPELHWGRPANQADAWNDAATASNAHVAGWLSNGGGGAIGSPPKGNSGGSNNGHSNDGPNGNSWNHSGGGADGTNNPQGKGNTCGDNGGTNQQAGSWNKGGGNEASPKNNGGGNATGGSWNGGGNSNNENQSAWKGGAEGNQNDSSWNNNGAATSSWNAGGGENSGGGHGETIW